MRLHHLKMVHLVGIKIQATKHAKAGRHDLELEPITALEIIGNRAKMGVIKTIPNKPGIMVASRMLDGVFHSVGRYINAETEPPKQTSFLEYGR